MLLLTIPLAVKIAAFVIGCLFVIMLFMVIYGAIAFRPIEETNIFDNDKLKIV